MFRFTSITLLILSCIFCCCERSCLENTSFDDCNDVEDAMESATTQGEYEKYQDIYRECCD